MRIKKRSVNIRNEWLSMAFSALLVSHSVCAAEGSQTWTIYGAEIDDAVLFDNDYYRQAIESSKSAVIENINYESVEGDIRHIEVEPVVFSDIFVSGKRFVGLPVICGSYQSAKSELEFRYIYLGSTAFTLVEEKSDDFATSWQKYCPRT